MYLPKSISTHTCTHHIERSTETVVFLYIGMQVFTISTSFSFSLIIWSLILILIGRATNFFPLSFLVNRFRTVNISPRMQFIMWFSGVYVCVQQNSFGKIVDQEVVLPSFKVFQSAVHCGYMYQHQNIHFSNNTEKNTIIIGNVKI